MLAYHTLYFAHLYLSPSEAAFEPFERAVEGRPGFGQTDLGDWSELEPGDVFAYCDDIDERVAGLVQARPFDAPSGFHWLPFSRGEAHLYNLPHIQHHAGRLIERLRQTIDEGTGWVFAVR
jgi:diadenosine tetraphosphatase ApaH/serine/threonine PP2A family protein phosphatase